MTHSGKKRKASEKFSGNPDGEHAVLWREIKETQKYVSEVDKKLSVLEGKWEVFFKIFIYLIIPLLFMILIAVIYNVLTVPNLPF